jgi:plasmid maintenance system antidote protein VapI
MHPIQRFLEQEKRTQRAFAREAGLSEGFVSQLVRGHERCGRDAALRIVAASDGAIDLAELLTWEPEQARAAS